MCNATGVAYGPGSLWVGYSDSRYVIQTINLEKQPGVARALVGDIEFSGVTDMARIGIDYTADGLRYREWDLARSVTEPPTREFRSGGKSIEGTGPCRHAMWSFQDASTHILLQEFGCTEENPPEKAKAELVVTASGKQTRFWVY